MVAEDDGLDESMGFGKNGIGELVALVQKEVVYEMDAQGVDEKEEFVVDLPFLH